MPDVRCSMSTQTKLIVQTISDADKGNFTAAVYIGFVKNVSYATVQFRIIKSHQGFS